MFEKHCTIASSGSCHRMKAAAFRRESNTANQSLRGSFAYAQQHLDHFNGFYPLPFSLFGKLYPARLPFTQEFYFLGGFGCFSQITTFLREPPAF
jgi:hypothetical protein